MPYLDLGLCSIQPAEQRSSRSPLHVQAPKCHSKSSRDPSSPRHVMDTLVVPELLRGPGI